CDPTVKPAADSYLYASDDEGATWHQIGRDIEQQGSSPHDFDFIPLGSFLLAVADVVPTTACSQKPGTSTFWLSHNGGTTWQKVATQAGFVSQLSLTLRASGGDATYCGVAVVWYFDAANLSRQAVLYWGGGPAIWKQLPALPGLDPNDVEYFPSGVTPSCTVIAQVNPFSGP